MIKKRFFFRKESKFDAFTKMFFLKNSCNNFSCRIRKKVTSRNLNEVSKDLIYF